MRYRDKPRLSGRLRATMCWPPILALSLLASLPIPAQGSIKPSPRESRPASAPPERLYTESELLATAQAAASKALDTAIPLAVQAAVAEERGKAAARHDLDLEAAKSFRRQVLAWRALALVATGSGIGATADENRGALYGASCGAAAAVFWWIVEQLPIRRYFPAPP
jgi:hypothetical protein